ncbi:MAG: hypothetical protein IJ043_07155 [Clostridia bacterium]|nr:hypothetical protein [Clostridia bacterium]
MIKGVGKQIVLLNNTDSDIFEQAIFILRSGDKVQYKDVVKECERMMNHHIKAQKEPPAHNWWKIGFFASLALVAILILICFLK